MKMLYLRLVPLGFSSNYLEYPYFIDSFFRYKANDIYRYDITLVRGYSTSAITEELTDKIIIYKHSEKGWVCEIPKFHIRMQNIPKKFHDELEPYPTTEELSPHCKQMVFDLVSLALEDRGHSILNPGGMETDYNENHRHLWSLPIKFDLSLAQHYGLPTRLLDWSHNSWKAAFFAAYNLLSNSSKHTLNKEDELAVYAIKIKAQDRQDSFIKVFDKHDRYLNKYLHAQDGLFTLVQGDYYFVENGKWPTIDELQLQEKNKKLVEIEKITIPQKEAKHLLQKLEKYGITIYTMMPNRNSVASYITHYDY